MIIYGQLYDVVSLQADGMFTVNTELVQVTATGAGVLSDEALKELANDPTMQDAAPMTFGGYGKAQIKIPAWKLFNRQEKEEYQKALSLHRRYGQFSTSLICKYGTADPTKILCIIAQALVGKTRIAMIKGRDKATGALDIRMVNGTDAMVNTLRPCVRQGNAAQT